MVKKTLQRRLYKVFEKYGSETAIEYKGKQFTYDEVDTKSNNIANFIISNNIAKGTFIGIIVEDKSELITTIIGVLKACCVFVPLDPTYPLKRLEAMISGTEVRYIFADRTTKSIMEGLSNQNKEKINIFDLGKVSDETRELKKQGEPEDRSEPDDAIYAYFTSGSTGKPKAIIGRNKSLLHFIEWEIETFNIDNNFKVSQFTPQCHDPYLRDIFIPLCTGGTVCIPESKEIILDTNRIINFIEKSQLSLIHCTPSLFKVFNTEILSDMNFSNLKYVLLAGERVIPSEISSWYDTFGDRIQLVNVYGPTETTLAKLYHVIQPSDAEKFAIPIGKPIKGARAILVDENMQLCPQGVVGEILIRTPYRTLGYYKNDELNSQKFIKNPFNDDSNDLVYRTGDLGKLLPDGDIEFVNRIDRQVKIRGFRVELNEIENDLLKFDGINNCVVDYRQDLKEPINIDEIICCVRCGLPSSYPGTTFNNEGVCNVCQGYEIYKDKAESYFKTIDDLKEKFDNLKPRQKNEYDCLLLYSGGKDSTYVLYKLVEMGLKVLAFTFDNGFISETAFNNIKNIVNELKVDYIVETYDRMKEVFLAGLKDECSVCNGCFKALRIISTKIAYEKGIKSIVTGFSRGQIYELRLNDVYKMNIFNNDDVEKKILEQRVLYHSKDDYAAKIIGQDALVKREMLEEVELIDFYRYTHVTKKEILDFLMSKSSYWANPSDTGFCSSNCMVNDVGIYVQRKERGYDNYTIPNSWEVRTGHMPLAESLKEFYSDLDVPRVKGILNDIGFPENYHRIGQSMGYLVAYYVSEEAIAETSLIKYLEERLPDYMIPTAFIRLDKLPLNANGKLDYKSLPDPKKVTKKDYIAPRNEVQKKLEKIWCELLGVERVSINEKFLNAGGHSLNAMSLIFKVYQTFEVELPLSTILNNPTIEELAGFIGEPSADVFESIELVGDMEYYPLSSAQKRIFILNGITGNDSSYNIPTAVVIEGELHKEKLEDVIKQIIERHDSFRTSFKLIEGNPVQRIQKIVDFSIKYMEGNEAEYDRLISEFVSPFDLRQAPLLRVGLVKTAKDKHLLIFDMHHIISDGTSMGILLKELAGLYHSVNLPKLKIQYKDYAVWQNNRLQSEKLKASEKYWTDLFQGDLPVLNLKTDYKRPLLQSFEGGKLQIKLNKELSERLNKLASFNDTTLFNVMIASYYVLLSKYTGQEDIIIGAPVAGRTLPDLENIIGMFVNTIALRNFPSGQKKFKDFLLEVKENSSNAFEHQDYQFEDLIDKIGINRDFGRNPLFDTMFAMQNVDIPNIDFKGLKHNVYEFNKKESKFDIILSAFKEAGGIKIEAEYCTKLFKRDTIERLLQNYINILKEVTNDPNLSISQINMLSEDEKTLILTVFNNTKSEYPSILTVYELFEQQVEKTPSKTALVCGNKKLTYRELNEKANSLAWILKEKGVKSDTIVGIIAGRTIEMIVGTLAILKSGGAYLPIESRYPYERVKYMIEDSKIGLILSEEKYLKKISGDVETININENGLYSKKNSNPECNNTPQNLAYVMYTSGSTGNPKGVMIEHRGIVRLIKNINFINLKEDDRILQTGAIVFDAATFEIWGALTNGLELHLVDEDIILDSRRLENEISKNCITTMWLTAPLFNQLAEQNPKMFNGLRNLIIGGDVVSPRHINMVRKECVGINIINGYGPTENTTFSTCFSIDKDYEENIPIGKPVSNSTVYIVGKDKNLMPIGVPGELCVGGDGIARGYLNRPELTTQKFIINPYVPETKMYMTGDLARWLPDGNVEFIQRMDQQVKVRGFRIELGEIENEILKHSCVSETVVTVKEDQSFNRFICAYIVGKKRLDISKLKEYLAIKLPEYMVPSYFLQLEKFPLTQNGKIDRMNLPDPDITLNIRTEYIAPSSETEEKLVAIWSEIFKNARVGINDNFFELGGNSLRLISLVSKLYKVFGIDIPIRAIVNSPTIRQIADIIYNYKDSSNLRNISSVQLLNSKKDKNIFAFPPGGGYGIAFSALAAAIENYSLYSFDYIDGEKKISDYADIILEIQNEKPYVFIGYSAGANLAFEVAKEMDSRGCEVSDIIMLDGFKKEKKWNLKPEDIENKVGEFLETKNELKEYLLKRDRILESIKEGMRSYLSYIDQLINEGSVNANIHQIKAEEESESERLNGDTRDAWAASTNGKFTVYIGKGLHLEMIDNLESLKHNADIVNKLLSNQVITLE